MTLVILGLFLTMMVAAMALISRQFHEIVGQEQEEQAFQVAEAGVHYSLWLISNGLLNLDNPAAITGHEVRDIRPQGANEVIGTFDVTFSVQKGGAGQPTSISLVSTGRDVVLVDRTQVIAAVIYAEEGEKFSIISWDHQP